MGAKRTFNRSPSEVRPWHVPDLGRRTAYGWKAAVSFNLDRNRHRTRELGGAGPECLGSGLQTYSVKTGRLTAELARDAGEHAASGGALAGHLAGSDQHPAGQ